MGVTLRAQVAQPCGLLPAVGFDGASTGGGRHEASACRSFHPDAETRDGAEVSPWQLSPGPWSSAPMPRFHPIGAGCRCDAAERGHNIDAAEVRAANSRTGCQVQPHLV